MFRNRIRKPPRVDPTATGRIFLDTPTLRCRRTFPANTPRGRGDSRAVNPGRRVDRSRRLRPAGGWKWNTSTTTSRRSFHVWLGRTAIRGGARTGRTAWRHRSTDRQPAVRRGQTIPYTDCARHRGATRLHATQAHSHFTRQTAWSGPKPTFLRGTCGRQTAHSLFLLHVPSVPRPRRVAVWVTY